MSIRRLFLPAVLGLLVAVSVASAAAAPTFDRGVVDVDTDLGYQNVAAAGTGMVLTSSGEILTNNHVIRGATTLRVTVPAGHTYSATVVGYDVSADVAVLKLRGASGMQTVLLGDSTRLKRGQAVTAVGNAGGAGGTPAVTQGKITALDQTITASDEDGLSEQLPGLIETDARLQPGDSGGPLLTSGGRIIGMDTAASSSFFFQPGSNGGYAIPIDRALAIAKQITAGRSSATVHIGATGFLGVDVQASGFYKGGALKPGALVVGLVPGSPAERSGLVVGDVITSLAGHSIASAAALTSLIIHDPPGKKVTLGWVDRAGKPSQATLTLASGPPQ